MKIGPAENLRETVDEGGYSCYEFKLMGNGRKNENGSFRE